MTQIIAFLTIFLASLIHSSFQLGVGILLLLNCQHKGLVSSRKKNISLNVFYILGVGVFSILLVSAMSYFVSVYHNGLRQLSFNYWLVIVWYLIIVSVLVLVSYYKKGGTRLWLPDSVRIYLEDRTKNTSYFFEAFLLGGATVIGELLFLLAPMVVASFSLVYIQDVYKIFGILLYFLISIGPLSFVSSLITSGHRLSVIQKWREDNKRFVQFSSSIALIVLACFIYVYTVGN